MSAAATPTCRSGRSGQPTRLRTRHSMGMAEGQDDDFQSRNELAGDLRTRPGTAVEWVGPTQPEDGLEPGMRGLVAVVDWTYRTGVVVYVSWEGIGVVGGFPVDALRLLEA